MMIYMHVHVHVHVHVHDCQITDAYVTSVDCAISRLEVRLSCIPSLYMSYLLLGKLGTRQYFEKVSSREIVQSTEE
jgi:hypothetical protein